MPRIRCTVQRTLGTATTAHGKSVVLDLETNVPTKAGTVPPIYLLTVETDGPGEIIGTERREMVFTSPD